ncbi:RNA polymerase sigma-70 factor [Mucilaginibacter pallidiroseus]|uniref:RNA polymerase sigma-70 factor n=1 Tax=Mucilaginibacter pallidiroseus TaxID=2599295 RepID=A0A563UCC5_9SPHI|nr:RNA polymerase sigma-70 factor [Mucilaginibacter pallidiroseus]TWR28933.1 RNA polymerase sigma-70 factor [Mucilaginibacter pallidiroseus]
MMCDFTKLTEEELIDLLKLDKPAAFREIYRRYWKELYAAAYKRLKNNETAEEVTQEVFTTFWHKCTEISISQTIAGYLHSSTSHLIIDQFRKEQVRARHRESFKLVYSESDTSTEDLILAKDLEETIAHEVNALPDKCRSVFALSRIEHKTNKEIAFELGISEKTVEHHITKALKRIRLGLGNALFLMGFLLLK